MDEDVENLADYLSEKNVRVEVEGRQNSCENFFENYQAVTGEEIDEDSDGVTILDEDADKWGIELRLYISDVEDFPEDYEDSLTKQNRPHDGYEDYQARLNDNSLIRDLIEYGFRIGDN